LPGANPLLHAIPILQGTAHNPHYEHQPNSVSAQPALAWQRWEHAARVSHMPIETARIDLWLDGLFGSISVSSPQGFAAWRYGNVWALAWMTPSLRSQTISLSCCSCDDSSAHCCVQPCAAQAFSQASRLPLRVPISWHAGAVGPVTIPTASCCPGGSHLFCARASCSLHA
jgi:hypothetical protein